MIFLKIDFSILKIRVTERETDLPSCWVTPGWPQSLRLGQAEAGSQELYPGVICACHGPKLLGHLLLFPDHYQGANGTAGTQICTRGDAGIAGAA